MESRNGVRYKICPNPECPTQTVAWGEEQITLIFGWRNVRGKMQPQSWCTNCRQAKARALSLRKRQARRAAVNRSNKPGKVKAPGLTIPADRKAVQTLYAKHYPGDKANANRALKFMVQRLMRKLPDAKLDAKLKTMFGL